MRQFASSAAYGIGEGFQWRVSLERRPLQAFGFYTIIGVAIGTGLLLNFPHIDPVKALFWSAILNGIVAAPLMAVIMMMASNRKVIEKFVIPPYLRWVGWCATAVMPCVCIGTRFLVGGLVVSFFAMIGGALKPKSFAGLFAAAPSVALATIRIIASGSSIGLYRGICGPFL